MELNNEAQGLAAMLTFYEWVRTAWVTEINKNYILYSFTVGDDQTIVHHYVEIYNDGYAKHTSTYGVDSENLSYKDMIDYISKLCLY
jgi:hypothetical protein